MGQFTCFFIPLKFLHASRFSLKNNYIQSTLFYPYHVNPYNFVKRTISDSHLSYNVKNIDNTFEDIIK